MTTSNASLLRHGSVALLVGITLLGNGRAHGGERRGLCEPSGTIRVGVEVKAPAGQVLAGVVVNVDYPEHAVSIPGTADQATVKARLSGLPEGFLASPNDLDDDLVVALAGAKALPPGPIFTVEFDRCKDAPKTLAKGFACKVEQASSETGVLVEGSTCVVTMISDPIKNVKERSL
jgi:hypothetical protein